MSEITLDSKVPEGPISDKWENHKFSMNLVNPNNKRKFEIIVVGTGLAGASAAASLGELGYRVKAFTYHDTPRRAHSIAAQGGINGAKNYTNDGDSVHRLLRAAIARARHGARLVPQPDQRRFTDRNRSRRAYRRRSPPEQCRRSASSTRHAFRTGIVPRLGKPFASRAGPGDDGARLQPRLHRRLGGQRGPGRHAARAACRQAAGFVSGALLL